MKETKIEFYITLNRDKTIIIDGEEYGKTTLFIIKEPNYMEARKKFNTIFAGKGASLFKDKPTYARKGRYKDSKLLTTKYLK